jgi:hypothetical protein
MPACSCSGELFGTDASEAICWFAPSTLNRVSRPLRSPPLAQLCKQYKISEVFGDKYAIEFHEAEWRTHGIKFIACEQTTSENYLRLLPQLMAGRVRLIDNRLANLLIAIAGAPAMCPSGPRSLNGSGRRDLWPPPRMFATAATALVLRPLRAVHGSGS